MLGSVKGSALCLALLVTALALPRAAQAYSRGVSFNGCNGCHGSGDQTMSVTMTPAAPVPGGRATVRITVTGTGAVAGLYADIGEGDWTVSSGGGLQRTEDGVTHAGPRTISGGRATFELEWTAPASPGSVRFAVSSVVGDGNGRSSGDGAADDVFDFVYGCEAQEYYRDFDGDGHGQGGLPRQHCAGAPPDGYSVLDDDCNDSDERAYPGVTEVCNGRDDDCDAAVDEESEPVTHYPDADGDGYYGNAERESGETFFGCGPMGGRWAPVGGDCQPMNPDVNPAAEDVCNGIDDDCDLDVDERVRPQCGQGWCRRNAFTCNPDDCVPGEPVTEICNYFDDDCDGGIDETACPAGQICGEFECVTDDGSGGGGGGGGGGGSGPGSSSDGGCSAAAGAGFEGAVALHLVLVLLVAGRRRRRG